jgi:Family of unknown function (DUF5681)
VVSRVFLKEDRVRLSVFDLATGAWRDIAAVAGDNEMLAAPTFFRASLDRSAGRNDPWPSSPTGAQEGGGVNHIVGLESGGTEHCVRQSPRVEAVCALYCLGMSYNGLEPGIREETGPQPILRRVNGRFAPGVSPNPTGRPKGTRNFANTIQMQTKDNEELVRFMLRVFRGKLAGAKVRHEDRMAAVTWLADSWLRQAQPGAAAHGRGWRPHRLERDKAVSGRLSAPNS